MLPNTLVGPIFAVRGHGEFFHTRRPRKSEPRAGRTPVSCVSDRGRHSSAQRNSEKSWCVRREPAYHSVREFTDSASLGKDRVLLAASVASLPQEPLGPGGCCLDRHRRLSSQKETPERSPRSSILSVDPHHPADSTKLAPLDSFVPHGTLPLCMEVPFRFDDTICGAGKYQVAETYLGFPHHPARCASHTGFFCAQNH